jgi:8-oxo-dGTP diphosphatase
MTTPEPDENGRDKRCYRVGNEDGKQVALRRGRRGGGVSGRESFGVHTTGDVSRTRDRHTHPRYGYRLLAMNGPLRTAALALVRDGRMLQARSHGKRAFYMVGGKIDPGETPIDALHREVREELGVDVVGSTVEFLGVFECPAFGDPQGRELHMSCFTADLTGEPAATSEIAELRWFTVAEYAAMPDVAPGSMLVFRHLQAQGLVN